MKLSNINRLHNWRYPNDTVFFLQELMTMVMNLKKMEFFLLRLDTFHILKSVKFSFSMNSFFFNQHPKVRMNPYLIVFFFFGEY